MPMVDLAVGELDQAEFLSRVAHALPPCPLPVGGKEDAIVVAARENLFPLRVHAPEAL